MSEKHDEPTICPWCQTEIVWDEEIGPESHCPHCENELSNYRTVQFGSELDDEEMDEEEELEDVDSWTDTGRDLSDLRPYNRDQLALEETMARILDEQLEAPECPTCREFMMEAGTQIVTQEQFQPRTPEALGEPVVSAPFQLQLYVCPSCFHAQNRLSVKDQERLVRLLTKAADLED
ncbi:hypothetical protein [Paenibacillus montanisoli]|uniref:Uncharacterized protein n=1 Tax=Paenibacillus montanisoli TaxID=2081970 RepID=A0A328U6G1_9BACL|nr:hypothetical protein [Paenibacillus montanisoli]RAP77353.1 hypothetical protein DL346_02345 [Paenibacillus montanisoli]